MTRVLAVTLLQRNKISLTGLESVLNTATMSTEKTASNPTPPPPFTLPNMDPMAIWAESQAQLTKMMTAALGRWQSFGDQYANVEAQVQAHAQNAVTNWAQLAKDAIAYGVQLSTDARKLSVETAKKMGINA